MKKDFQDFMKFIEKKLPKLLEKASTDNKFGFANTALFNLYLLEEYHNWLFDLPTKD